MANKNDVLKTALERLGIFCDQKLAEPLQGKAEGWSLARKLGITNQTFSSALILFSQSLATQLKIADGVGLLVGVFVFPPDKVAQAKENLTKAGAQDVQVFEGDVPGTDLVFVMASAIAGQNVHIAVLSLYPAGSPGLVFALSNYL